jgi:acyl carrier protein
MSSSVEQSDAAAAQIEGFLRKRFRIAADDPGFTREVNLWEEGYVDSVGVVEVIEFLEQTFKVRISDDALFSPEFTCVAGMAGFVTNSLEPSRPLSLEA